MREWCYVYLTCAQRTLCCLWSLRVECECVSRESHIQAVSAWQGCHGAGSCDICMRVRLNGRRSLIALSSLVCVLDSYSSEIGSQCPGLSVCCELDRDRESKNTLRYNWALGRLRLALGSCSCLGLQIGLNCTNVKSIAIPYDTKNKDEATEQVIYPPTVAT